jgi:hypothetical protein
VHRFKRAATLSESDSDRGLEARAPRQVALSPGRVFADSPFFPSLLDATPPFGGVASSSYGAEFPAVPTLDYLRDF